MEKGIPEVQWQVTVPGEWSGRTFLLRRLGRGVSNLNL